MKGFLCWRWVSQSSLKMPQCIVDNYWFLDMKWDLVSGVVKGKGLSFLNFLHFPAILLFNTKYGWKFRF